MVVSLLVWQAVNFLWCFLTPSSHAMVYVIWALGGMTSMGAIASAGSRRSRSCVCRPATIDTACT